MSEKWDSRFIELARLIASWSKDTSTRVGAVIVDEQRRIVGTGYNGFARGCADDPALYADRERKYRRVVHAAATCCTATCAAVSALRAVRGDADPSGHPAGGGARGDRRASGAVGGRLGGSRGDVRRGGRSTDYRRGRVMSSVAQRVLLRLDQSEVPVRTSLLVTQLVVTRSQLWAALRRLERMGMVTRDTRVTDRPVEACPCCRRALPSNRETFWARVRPGIQQSKGAP